MQFFEFMIYCGNVVVICMFIWLFVEHKRETKRLISTYIRLSKVDSELISNFKEMVEMYKERDDLQERHIELVKEEYHRVREQNSNGIAHAIESIDRINAYLDEYLRNTNIILGQPKSASTNQFIDRVKAGVSETDTI